MTWKRDADRIIRGVLKELPPAATQREVEKALAKAYPWSRQGYAYQAWLAVRKQHLDLRFPEQARARDRAKLAGLMKDRGLVPESQEQPALFTQGEENVEHIS